MANRKVLITGITGQDGSYLAELLLSHGHQVYGLTRDPTVRPGPNVAHLANQIKLIYSSYEQADLIDRISELRPSDIYNFAGQTSVSKSWEMLDDTINASGIVPCRLLDAIVRVDRDIRFFQASSPEIATCDWQNVISETSPIAPATPYGCAKAMAHTMVMCYRKNYGIYAVNGILFQHESPRRHEAFASRKVVARAVAIKLGRETELALGNIDVARDWSFAPDVVTAIERMMQQESPEDFVICSGETHSLVELVEIVFGLLNLDYRDHLRIDRSLFRAKEPPIIRGSNAKAKMMLDWRPKIPFSKMLEKMVECEMALQTGAIRNFGTEKPFA
jgi:GDPmannose 4,6-dehydratase